MTRQPLYPRKDGETRERSRVAVYAAIDSERAYQNERWGLVTHTVAEYILYMEVYLTEAKQRAGTRDQSVAINHKDTMDFIRKVTALGVVCMEDNGAPHREGYG